MNSVAHHNPYMYILPERITSSLLETPENKKQAQFYFEFYLSSKISSFTERSVLFHRPYHCYCVLLVVLPACYIAFWLHLHLNYYNTTVRRDKYISDTILKGVKGYWRA